MRYSHLNPATLYGETTAKEREQMKAKFINDPTCRLMIANPQSGGVGVDGLQGVCSHAAFVEMVSTPGLFEQAISRLHRTGQTGETVNIYLFTAMETVALKLRNDLALCADSGTGSSAVHSLHFGWRNEDGECAGVATTRGVLAGQWADASGVLPAAGA